MTAEELVKRIPIVNSKQSAEIIATPYGVAVKITGKGAKLTAQYWVRENYLNGTFSVDYGVVRHGLGYVVPYHDSDVVWKGILFG